MDVLGEVVIIPVIAMSSAGVAMVFDASTRELLGRAVILNNTVIIVMTTAMAVLAMTNVAAMVFVVVSVPVFVPTCLPFLLAATLFLLPFCLPDAFLLLLAG